MSSQQKRKDRALARRDADGYPGLIPLDEIYYFEQFLTQEHDWHSAVTSGNELLHVYRRIGEEIIVWYNGRTTITSRHGMGLYLNYLTFSKRKDVYYHEQMDRDERRDR